MKKRSTVEEIAFLEKRLERARLRRTKGPSIYRLRLEGRLATQRQILAAEQKRAAMELERQREEERAEAERLAAEEAAGPVVTRFIQATEELLLVAGPVGETDLELVWSAVEVLLGNFDWPSGDDGEIFECEGADA